MSCYICSQPPTSVEHTPARCFFPLDKRKNLITVDSCTVHNEDTSKDDEYVRNIIAMSLGNNGVALEHFLEKCIASFKKSPGLLITTTKNRKRVHYQEPDQKSLQPTYAFEIDRTRINFVLRKIAYALFFKKFRTPWNRELIVGTEFLRTEGMETDEIGNLIQSFKPILGSLTFEGENPDVFRYYFGETNNLDINDQILIMVFYEGFEVWVIPKIGSVGPRLEK